MRYRQRDPAPRGSGPGLGPTCLPAKDRSKGFQPVARVREHALALWFLSRFVHAGRLRRWDQRRRNSGSAGVAGHAGWALRWSGERPRCWRFLYSARSPGLMSRCRHCKPGSRSPEAGCGSITIPTCERGGASGRPWAARPGGGGLSPSPAGRRRPGDGQFRPGGCWPLSSQSPAFAWSANRGQSRREGFFIARFMISHRIPEERCEGSRRQAASAGPPKPAPHTRRSRRITRRGSAAAWSAVRAGERPDMRTSPANHRTGG